LPARLTPAKPLVIHGRHRPIGRLRLGGDPADVAAAASALRLPERWREADGSYLVTENGARRLREAGLAE
jgi:hypothetical protein